MKKALLILMVVACPRLAQGASTNSGHPESLDHFLMLSEPYVGNISAYNPMYFLIGTDPADSKFQISLKYRLFERGRSSHPWLERMYFAFTQTSFWDLQHRSLPFKDTSYKPELFYNTANLASQHASWADGLFFKGGFRHESNGRGDPDSRSTNSLYLQAYLIFLNSGKKLGLRVSPVARIYLANDNRTNPDLADYRGYVGLHLKSGWAEGFVFSADMRWAGRGGSYSFGTTVPIRTSYVRMYANAEFVSVLAESLLDYQRRTTVLRLGFSVVR